MPRYVLGDDVWQIVQTGKQLEITTRGKPTTRTFVTPEQAVAQFDKLVADKLAAGYQLVARDPRHTQLEAVIAGDPENPTHYAVYADWLESVGDPRGRLIALQIAAEGKPKLAATAAKQLDEYADDFLGALAPHAIVVDDEPVFTWRFGFIHRVYLHADRQAPLDDVLARVLAHPSGRFIVQLAMGRTERMAEAIAVLVRRAPPSLRALRLWAVEHLELAPLWQRVPELRRLSLSGRALAVGDLELPALERLELVDEEMPRDASKALANNAWPALQLLRLDFGRGFLTHASIDDVFAFLGRRDLPAFTQLALVHTRYANELVREIAASPIAAQLRALDLSHNFLEDRHAVELAGHAAKFPALTQLDVSHNDGITQVGLDALRAAGFDVR